jgi:hypothetical protein
MCLLVGLAGTGNAGAANGGRASQTADAGSGSGSGRVVQTLPPGLTKEEYSALVKAGAYGHRPVRMLVVGDSIAMTLGMGLVVDSQSNYGVTLLNHATLGCDLDPDTEAMYEGISGRATQGCGEWRGLWPFLAAGVHPQVVVLGVGRWETSDHLFLGQWMHVGQPLWDAHIEQDLRDAIAIFRGEGARVVLLTMPYVDPPSAQPDGEPWPENSPSRVQAFNNVLADVAAHESHGVSLVNLNQLLSPDGVYTTTLHHQTVRWPDGIHVTVQGGELLQRDILPVVARIGLADEAAAAKAAARNALADKAPKIAEAKPVGSKMHA